METKKECFSELVKDEICHLELNNDQAYYLTLAFLINNSEFYIDNKQKKYLIQTHYCPIIRFIKKLLLLVDKNIKINVLESNIKTAKQVTKWVIEIQDYESIDKVFNNFEYDIKNFTEEQRKFFITGAFLSSGSISFSNDKSSYHFEIRSRNKNFLNDLKSLFKSFNINANILSYRNLYKLYFKKSEYLGDTLKILGAIDNLYKFEDIRIQRDFINSQQRLNNLDISNITKTISAANNQLKWIQTLKNEYMYDSLDNKTKIFCEIRNNHQEASLDEIVNIFKKQYQIELSKSSVNHITRKLKQLYLIAINKK